MRGIVAECDTYALTLLLEKIYRDSGYDFREYKQSTITRRLARRLEANGLADYRGYMRFLDISPKEYQKLAEDITIKASGFFRTPFAFEQVADQEYIDDVDYVRIYISHLRQKIEPEPNEPRYIFTEPGVGYYFKKIN